MKKDPLVFWGPHFALAIDKLRKMGAKTVGIDFIFLVSAEEWLEKTLPENNHAGDAPGRFYDSSFREQISSGDVVLAGTVAVNNNGSAGIVMPHDDYLYALPDVISSVGIINTFPDDDGVIRHFVPGLSAGETRIYSFPVLLAAKATGSSPDDIIAGSDIKGRVPIGFAGPPESDSFPRISFADILDSDSVNNPDLKKFVSNKIVIISDEQSGSNDFHLTPYSRRFFGQGVYQMTGAEVHANVIETIVSGNFPRRPTAYWTEFHTLLIILFSSFFFRFVKAKTGALSGILLAVLTAFVSYLFFKSGIILPVSAPQVGIAAAFILAMGFHFTGEEKKRRHLRMIFNRYVSEAVIEKLADEEKLPEPGGEPVEITVLFSDIRNFTTISEILSPSDVVEMLNSYFKEVCTEIHAEGGVIDKFIGDAVMAVFGNPVKHPDHAARALRAAVRMRKRATGFREWMKNNIEPDIYSRLPEFDTGIGIHTGMAIAGNIGFENRLEYTAIGDAVNIAARIESETKNLGWPVAATMETVCSAYSFKRNDDIFSFGDSKKISVKGRTGIISVVEIINESEKQ